MAILLTASVFLYLEFFPKAFQNNDILIENGTYTEITGRVAAKEVRKDYLGEKKHVIYIVPLPDGAKGSKSASSMQVQCYLEDFVNLPAIGEYVCVGGKVRIFEPPTNPGEFDSCLYYSTLKILYRLSGAAVLKRGGRANVYREGLFALRMVLEDSLDRVLPMADSAVMKAMLLGDRTYIDQDTRDMYQGSGIMHILAISGLHISIIGIGLYRLLRRISELIAGSLPGIGCVFGRLPIPDLFAATVSIAFMHSYGVMCGMSSSSFRAIMMFALRLIAPLVGRTYDILSALALAEILLVLDQPLYLLNSGFLFSFGAVLGIAVLKPVLKSTGVLAGRNDVKMKFVDEEGCATLIDKAKAMLTEGISAGVSVLIVTLPVYSCFYYTYPLMSLVLNLVVVPLMGILMVLGICTMLIGTLWTLPGETIGLLVRVHLSFYRWLCSGESLRQKFTWYMGHSDKWQVILYVVVITAFTALSYRIRDSRMSRGDSGKRVITGERKLDALRALMVMGAVFLLTLHFDPRMEITMVDVGQGDGILVSCNGDHMLIDGGSTSKNSVGRYQLIPVMKYKGIGKLSTIVLTHEDADHMSGILEIMDDMERGGIFIGGLILPEISDNSRGENYNLLEQRAGDLGIPVSFINTGETFSLGGEGGAHFTCLNPCLNMETESANAYSTVLYMDYNGLTALFCGDMEKEGLDNVKSVLRREMPQIYDDKGITLLKVAHHGSEYTTDDEFLDLTRPEIALISCGRNNSYGHPHKGLLERLKAHGSIILRTDEGGCTSIRFDGKNLSAGQYLK